MNNYYHTMAVSIDLRNRTKAIYYTLAFAALMVMMMFIKWQLPVLEKPITETTFDVEVNWPPEPTTVADGGGGGGNPVQASGPKGIADPTPSTQGVKEPSKDIEENNDKTATPIAKPIVTKPKAKVVINTAEPKAEPKPVVVVPAPRVPKAVKGQTTTGTNTGGGSVTDYEKPGGSGTGSGVGNGSGTGGGTGTGSGGGNGSGTGIGAGPRVTNGDRKIVRSYSFEDNLDKATIYANVSVSPEGIGTFISIAKGSTNSNTAYRDAIKRYLQNIRFDKSDHESMVTVIFNFVVN